MNQIHQDCECIVHNIDLTHNCAIKTISITVYCDGSRSVSVSTVADEDKLKAKGRRKSV